MKKDIAILKKLKIDFLLIPNESQVYKRKKDKKIKLNYKDKILCAKYRPGHFEGVLAVINQFLSEFKPKYIFFGEKDYQQLFLIKKLIKKKYNTKVYSCLTVRDQNKVALSSRNVLLKKNDIKKSSYIAKLLFKFKNNLKKNISNKKNLNTIILKLLLSYNLDKLFLFLISKYSTLIFFILFNFKKTILRFFL